MKDVSEFQKLYLEINGGNVVATARQLGGVKGDNAGALVSMISLMKDSDPKKKSELANLYQGSGLSELSDSVDKMAIKISTMMNDGVPLPKSLHQAAVYHGVIAMKEGSVSENTKAGFLDGVSTLARESSITDAVKVLDESTTSSKLTKGDQSPAQTKALIKDMDSELSMYVSNKERAVEYDSETDTFRVFNPTKTIGPLNTSVPELNIDTQATKDLNSLYNLRKNGRYSTMLESASDFRDFWLNKYSPKVLEVEGPVKPTFFDSPLAR